MPEFESPRQTRAPLADRGAVRVTQRPAGGQGQDLRGHHARGPGQNPAGGVCDDHAGLPQALHPQERRLLPRRSARRPLLVRETPPPGGGARRAPLELDFSDMAIHETVLEETSCAKSVAYQRVGFGKPPTLSADGRCVRHFFAAVCASGRYRRPLIVSTFSRRRGLGIR